MAKKKTRGRSKGREVGGDSSMPGRGRAYPLAFRLKVVEEALRAQVSLAQLSRVFGPSVTTIEHWLTLYESGGLDALVPTPPTPPKRERTYAQEVKREAVVTTRQEHPEWGTRRISDVLGRFQALGVSETEVRSILHEAGLIPETRATSGPREHAPRRFERAAPNQMWQSDIFTFLLRRHERVYLTAFMDDHSRFIVGWALARHQRSALVMEALARGIAAFGTPQEILTDQGRQYTAWRGETDFEEELRRNGIRHVKSRPQHPQTLGKVERFWKTLWDEWMTKTLFADYQDCEKRLGLFIDGYNFQRPHQALGGLTPADRFFRAAPQVREAVEKSVAANATRLAHEQVPRKPFYLVGRLGDQDLTISTQGSGLRVQMGAAEPETIRLPKEESDAEQQEADDRPTTRTHDAGVAARESGPRRDGAASMPDGAERLERREAGDGRHRGGADIARHVLQPGGARAQGDAGGARAGSGGGAERESGDAHRGAREEGSPARAAEAAWRALAALDAKDAEAGAYEDGRPRAALETPSLDGAWEEAFAGLEDEDEDDDNEGSQERPQLDPDDGWRDRALRWERKLAGATSPSDGLGSEASDGEEERLCAGADDRRRDESALRGGAAGLEWGTDGDGGGQATRPLPQSISDTDASRARGAGQRAGAESVWPDTGERDGARAQGGERAPQAPRAETLGRGRDGGPDARHRERDGARPREAQWPWPDEGATSEDDEADGGRGEGGA